jgi:ribonucleoside-diphosphate reductase alpha chain
MDTIGTLTSMALQYGVPLNALVTKFAHMRFEPSGWTGNPDIPNAKSVPDYIFRWLGIQFIPGFRAANTPNRNGNGNGHAEGTGAQQVAAVAAELAAVLPESGLSAGPEAAPLADGPQIRSQQFAKFQADAPACDNCGAITVRNGNCYLCHNCGNSMGCS